MYKIICEYKFMSDMVREVVGHRFGTKEEAERFLQSKGWRRDEYSPDFCKEGPTRMHGLIGVSMTEYVKVVGS